jgi:hypothetical protein
MRCGSVLMDSFGILYIYFFELKKESCHCEGMEYFWLGQAATSDVHWLTSRLLFIASDCFHVTLVSLTHLFPMVNPAKVVAFA